MAIEHSRGNGTALDPDSEELDASRIGAVLASLLNLDLKTPAQIATLRVAEGPPVRIEQTAFRKVRDQHSVMLECSRIVELLGELERKNILRRVRRKAIQRPTEFVQDGEHVEK